MYNTLPNAAILHNFDNTQIFSMMKFRRQAPINQILKKDMSLPDMMLPKLIAQIFVNWNTSFTNVVGRQNSLAVISLYYLLSEVKVSNYERNWPTREKTLKHCIVLREFCYTSNTESLH